MHIESGSVGHSYDQTFGHLLDDMVTSVEVDDPYVRSAHQRDQQSQLDRLSQVKASLADNGVVMAIEYSETLHDREIRLDTGWIIKIGRGLDYFRPAATKFSLGYFDHDLRTCHETTIDIFHRNYVHTS
uniref:Microtubule interacting and transport (MIT) domain containing protein n=1 Tax=Rhipicephalus zambeziensis TaxID=60191 RepID=A0A224YYZ3_9ACAR